MAWLDRAEQVHWLTRAAEEGWSAAHLRDRLRDAGLIAQPRSPAHVQRLVTQVVKLSREEIPDQMVEQLACWWSGLQPAAAPLTPAQPSATRGLLSLERRP